MNHCAITYEKIPDDKVYSIKGIKKLNRGLTDLKNFPYSAAKQRHEAVIQAGKLSIQGIQPKISARLNIKDSVFEIVDRKGQYIIKPQHADYNELPENEDLSMHMAEVVNITVPLHGLIYCLDGSRSYFIKRFDRLGKNKKISTEDFAQLSGRGRDTKYDYSMEKLIKILDYCTFPVIERLRLFRRCIFNFIIGNEDMHLKNFSVITRNNKTELTPAYDFLSTTTAYIALGKSQDKIEEIALPLKGKKRGLTSSIWFEYFGKERLKLTDKSINNELQIFSNIKKIWIDLINRSFLSGKLKDIYLSLLNERFEILNL